MCLVQQDAVFHCDLYNVKSYDSNNQFEMKQAKRDIKSTREIAKFHLINY